MNPEHYSVFQKCKARGDREGARRCIQALRPIDDMNLRQATAADSQFVFETKKAAFRTYVEMVSGWDEADQRQMHERRFAEQ